MKIYRVSVKRKNGHVGVAERFDSKKEAIDCLSYLQSVARFEMRNKRCKPMEEGCISVACEYDNQFQIVELFLEEAEKPEWDLVKKFDLEDNPYTLL